MNRSDLINALKDKVAFSRKDAGKVVDTFFDALKETLAKGERSEEHTSELQSHSFISYAVFCLKKKNI